MSTQKSIEEIGKTVHLILNNTLDRKLTRAEYSKVVEGVQAMLQSERDRADEENEGTCRFPIEYKRYIQDCLATDNRKWIEPQFIKLKNSYERGYLNGHNDGYDKGLKENKILPPEFNPALTNPQDNQ